MIGLLAVACQAPVATPYQTMDPPVTMSPTAIPWPVSVAIPQDVGLQLTIQHPGSTWRYVEHVPSVKDAQAWALRLLGPRDYDCLYSIVWHESHWDPYVSNHEGSGAYGLPQAKPGSRMATAGADWQENPETQLKWMRWYVDEKYGSFCGAELYREQHGFY